jgi:uncharacterized protein
MAVPPFVLASRSPADPKPDLTLLLVTHRAIRQDLARLAAVLAQSAEASAATARYGALRRYAAALFAEISNHFDDEDAVFWPVIAATAGQCVDLGPLTDDHQAIGAALDRALAAFAASSADRMARSGELVNDLAGMLDGHIADEERQIIPAVCRYTPAYACRWSDERTWHRASLASLRFRVPWLARFASPGELATMLDAAGWQVRLLLAAARPRYARLERRAFAAGPQARGKPAASEAAHARDMTDHPAATTPTKEIPMERQKVRFTSGSIEYAAWHYPGTNGACIIMTGGFGVTKEPGTDRFARRFHQAGFSVLAFDYRRLGESGGQPRQVIRIADELDDWDAAIGYAATRPEVDPARLAIWGFSSSGGHVFRVAARHPQLAAAIAQTPNADGPAAARNAARYQKPLAMLRFTGIGVADALGGLVGRKPRLIPLTGEPGTAVLVTSPDGRDGGRVLNPDGAYPDWQQAVAARSTLRMAFYTPGRDAAKVSCPLLVLVCDQDQTALAAPAIRAARHAPRAELVRLPGGHYAPFLDSHEQAVAAELSFLRRHLLGHQVISPGIDGPALGVA